MKTFPLTQETFQLKNADNELEVLTTPGQENFPVAIICHPHPLFGGTMQNKVVTTLAKTFETLGLSTVRFNFRGIGKSTGSYGEGILEQEDLLHVVEWVQTVLPNTKIWLAGFSFGGYIATSVSTKIFPEKLILVAPSVEHFDMSKLQVPCPWILVQGDQDEVVPAKAVFAWMKTQKVSPTLIEIANATHFFHGKLVEMRERLGEVLNLIKNQ